MRKLAVVTGASGGLGEQIARQLAARGYDLVMVARDQVKMERIASELVAAHGISAIIEPADLSQPGSAAMLYERLTARGVVPDVFINNAAFGMTGSLINSDPDQLRGMLQLDVISMTELTLLFGRAMRARGQGHIMIVGSLSAFQPNPNMAAYGAAKAYALSFGEAVHVELAPKVIVTVLTPGLMDTGFNAASGFQTPPGLRRTMLAPEEVARIGLDALFAGKSGVVAGRINAIMAFGSRFLSRHAAAKAAHRMGQKTTQQING
ncbi:MAG: SDR family NAD(P)-dependent oxidoreductase [Pararhodobacter sp.]|nr:SDR family NAD(P)-dependent oxidoreductase [Pararhodobacter sp.]